MKTIILVRHGKAEEQGTEKTDYDRVLIERGMNDSAAVAVKLENRKIQPSLIISSPAPRALATAKVIAGQLGYRKKSIRTRKMLYDQLEGALLDVVHMIGDEFGDVIIVGHNPSIEEFTRFLAKKFKGTVPTCGVVGLRCKVDSWKDISGNSGKLTFVETPSGPGKSTPPKIVKKEIEEKFYNCIVGVCAEDGIELKGKALKQVKKTIAELTQLFTRKSKKKAKKKSK